MRRSILVPVHGPGPSAKMKYQSASELKLDMYNYDYDDELRCSFDDAVADKHLCIPQSENDW